MPGTSVSWRVDQASLNFTIIAIGNAQVSLREAGIAAVRGAGQKLRARVRDNVSSTAYTLAELARKDHPYARRHREILPIFRRRKYMLDGRHAVHVRTGTLRNALRGSMRQGRQVAYDLDFDRNAAPWVSYVLEGTRYMLPRDPLWQTAQSPEMIREMREGVVKALGKGLRSQAAIRFHP